MEKSNDQITALPEQSEVLRPARDWKSHCADLRPFSSERFRILRERNEDEAGMDSPESEGYGGYWQIGFKRRSSW
jgi:hypothetical protein